MDANLKSTHDDFTRLIHLVDPSRDGGFTTGTINVRHRNGATIVGLNTSDNTVTSRRYRALAPPERHPRPCPVELHPVTRKEPDGAPLRALAELR